MILVLGHESCGAVTAAVKGGDNGPNLNHLCGHISSAVEQGSGKELSEVIKINAINNAKDMINNSEIIKNAVDNNVKMIMMAHIAMPALDSSKMPASHSYKITTDLLNGEAQCADAKG